MRIPAKLALLIAFVIRTILRAVCLSGVSSANLCQLPALSAAWQSVQFKPRDAAKNAIVPMNWSTGIPLRTWMFLKTVSDISAFCSGAAWPLAHATPQKHAHAAHVAQRTVRFHPVFISAMLQTAWVPTAKIPSTVIVDA